MNRAQKTELSKALTDKFGKAKVAIFADYKGLSASQADVLRKVVRDKEGEVLVLKNNVARLITKEGQMGDQAKELMDGLVGPTMVAFAYNDPATVAKAVHEFSKDNEALTLKDSLMAKSKVGAADIEALANLPSREVLLGQLLGQLNAPVQNFVMVLAGVPRAFVTVLSAIAEKKEKEGA